MQFSIALQLVAVNGNPEPMPDLVFILLRGVRDSGNLTAAAKLADVSYRKAWNLLGHWATALGSPLLDATRGRGAKLTDLGAKLLWAKNHMDSRGMINLEEVITHIQSELQSVLVLPETISNEKLVEVAASHCVCLDILQNLYQGDTLSKISLGLFGSQTSLSRLQNGQCQFAGFHLASGSFGSGYLTHYSEAAELGSMSAVLSHQRRQGLIVAEGNPLDLQSVADLTRADVSMVNRQSGSGTRVLLDLLMASAGLRGGQVKGYEDIEQTHTAVCARIANRQADVALGTQASAAQFGLGFIPLIDENYYFGFRREDGSLDALKKLVTLLSSRVWAQAIDLIPGMNAQDAGIIVEDVSRIAG